MHRLLNLPLDDPDRIAALRREFAALPDNTKARIALGIGLSDAGCTYESASILRPLRPRWKSSPAADKARFALDAQTWWNKNWRDFVRLKRSGNLDAALTLLGDRAPAYWDLPPLLVHLGDIALKTDRPDLAAHLYRRVHKLSQRGLPKMNMAAFEYVAQAALVETLLHSGKANAALARHREITPNPGNAMAHEMQHARLLVATSDLDTAMRQVASTLITAEKHRSGYSKAMRDEFVESAPDLAPLRTRADWAGMLADPAAYLRGS